MKTIKIILPIAFVTVFCPFIWSWTVIPASTIILPSIAHNSTKPSQDVTRKNELRIAFWRLVNSGNTNKESYDTLIKKYGYKNLTEEEKSILLYLKKICKDSESFLKFRSISKIDRISATKLSDISID